MSLHGRTLPFVCERRVAASSQKQTLGRRGLDVRSGIESGPSAPRFAFCKTETFPSMP